MDKPIDIIMWAGEEHYTVSSFIEEAERMGVSKRIPRTAIPEGIVPGQSRILIKHRQAIVQSDRLDELFLIVSHLYDILEFALTNASLKELGIPDTMLRMVMFLEDLKVDDYTAWQSLVEDYNLTWTSGVIGYSYITSIQYIAYDDEEELPEDLQHLEGYVKPVRIEYDK
ncbi:hypothetical protein KA005_28430 [bacterium]|nr:hypothetical protein [bacterium]